MLRKLTIVSILCALPLCVPAQAKETLIFAHLYSEMSLQHQVLLEADKELAERSGNQIGLEIKPHGQLGDQDTRIMEAVNVGQADMTFVSGAFAARDYAPMGVTSAPFVFRDFAHWQHFKDSPLASELATAYEKASGMVVLGYYYYGVRQLNSKQPIKRPEDLIGLRIRVPNAPIYLQLFRALGATPVPLPFWQTYDALRQDTIDAEENPLPTIEDGKIYKIAPFITLSAHVTDSALVLISAKRLAALPENQQKLVRDVFGKLADRLTERVRSRERDDMGKLKAMGVSFLPIDRDALAAKTATMVKGTGFAWSGDLYDRLRKIP